MLNKGDAVTLEGRKYRGSGIVVAVFADANAPGEVRHPFGRNERTRKRPNQPFPQYGVATKEGRAMHYNADDERNGVIRPHGAPRPQAAQAQGAAPAGPCALDELVREVRALAEKVNRLENE